MYEYEYIDHVIRQKKKADKFLIDAIPELIQYVIDTSTDEEIEQMRADGWRIADEPDAS
jgi:hypothetical protein